MQNRSTLQLIYQLLKENSSSRIRAIGFGYDETERRFDGLIAYEPEGLSDEQLLFCTLGGRVAELMARTEGNWNITEIQKRHLNGEFDQTQDTEHVKLLLAKLCSDNENNKQEQILAQMIFQVFSFLEEHWETVKQVTSDLLSKYDHESQKAIVTLSPETQEQLRRMRKTSL